MIYYVRCLCGCGRTFEASRSNQKFLNHNHYMKWRNKQVKAEHPVMKCERCGKQLIRLRKDQRYCSDICRKLSYEKRTVTIPMIMDGKLLLTFVNGELVNTEIQNMYVREMK